MAVSYEWIFSQFDTIPSLDGLTDVVKVIHWRINATDGDYMASNYGTVTIADPSPSDFTPYDQITKEQAISWVSSAMDVNSQYESLQNQINLMKNPPTLPMAPPF